MMAEKYKILQCSCRFWEGREAAQTRCLACGYTARDAHELGGHNQCRRYGEMERVWGCDEPKRGWPVR